MSQTPDHAKPASPLLAAAVAELETARSRALLGPMVSMPADLAISLFDVAIGLLLPHVPGEAPGEQSLAITAEGASSLSSLADIVHSHRRSVVSSNAARLFGGSVIRAQ